LKKEWSVFQDIFILFTPLIMKEKVAYFIIVWVVFSFNPMNLQSQSFQDSIRSNRLAWTASALGVGYGTSTYLLNETWYKDYSKSSFHFFNDLGEWQYMDKVGHVYSAQFQSNYAYHLYRWTGLNERKSILYGSLTSLLFQTTIEVLDGFSEEWGFSTYDFGANVVGTSLFAFQQTKWGEQRITMKVSGGKRTYDDPILEERANDLFGSSWPSRLLKDYNHQTYWMSFNIHSFLSDSKWPKWLNVAVGYGAENMYGGFDNSWLDQQNLNEISANDYPRYQQFYIGPDIDLTKIPVKSKFLKGVLGAINIFKIPMPYLKMNTLGKVGVGF